MAETNEYMLFLDESGVTRYNRNLLLGGIAINRKEYEEVLIPAINGCKSIIGEPHIVLHYTDMLKKQKDFSCLCRDVKTTETFWSNLIDSLKNTKFNILSAYLNIDTFRLNYPKELCYDAYELLFSTIINNYIYFLNRHNYRGSIILESRQEKQNQQVQQYYFDILRHGTNIYSSVAINKYITTTNFFVKSENCIGLQVADIVAYNCMHTVNKQKDHYDMWKTALKHKQYKGNNNVNVYGVVKLF